MINYQASSGWFPNVEAVLSAASLQGIQLRNTDRTVHSVLLLVDETTPALSTRLLCLERVINALLFSSRRLECYRKAPQHALQLFHSTISHIPDMNCPLTVP